VLSEVAQGHPDVVTTPAPLPLFLGFGDSALQFSSGRGRTASTASA